MCRLWMKYSNEIMNLNAWNQRICKVRSRFWWILCLFCLLFIGGGGLLYLNFWTSCKSACVFMYNCFLYTFFFGNIILSLNRKLTWIIGQKEKAAVFVNQHISQNQVFWILAGRRLSQSVTSKFLVGTGSVWSTKTYMSPIIMCIHITY